MGIILYAFVFRWGRLLKSVPTHISTSMSAYYAGKRALGFEYYTASLILYRRTLPNDHIQVLHADQLLFIGVKLLRSSTYI